MVDLAISAATQVIGGLLGKGSSNDTANQITEQQIAAINEAMGIITSGYSELLGSIEGGVSEGGAALVNLAKADAAKVLEIAGVTDSIVQAMGLWADSKLEPFRQVGIFAFDEWASMMGIRNSKGEKVPWNPKLIEDTPGYQWAQSQMQLATQREAAARGTLLSGRTAIEVNDRAGSVAGAYWDKRVSELMQGAQLGQQAAANQAQNITQNAGIRAGIGNQAMSSIASIGIGRTNALAGLLGLGIEGAANIGSANIAAQADLALAIGGANVNNTAVQGANTANLIQTAAGAVPDLLDWWRGNTTKSPQEEEA